MKNVALVISNNSRIKEIKVKEKKTKRCREHSKRGRQIQNRNKKMKSLKDMQNRKQRMEESLSKKEDVETIEEQIVMKRIETYQDRRREMKIEKLQEMGQK